MAWRTGALCAPSARNVPLLTRVTCRYLIREPNSTRPHRSLQRPESIRPDPTVDPSEVSRGESPSDPVSRLTFILILTWYTLGTKGIKAETNFSIYCRLTCAFIARRAHEKYFPCVPLAPILSIWTYATLAQEGCAGDGTMYKKY